MRHGDWPDWQGADASRQGSGWVCPRCGKAYAPAMTQCFCEPHEPKCEHRLEGSPFKVWGGRLTKGAVSGVCFESARVRAVAKPAGEPNDTSTWVYFEVPAKDRIGATKWTDCTPEEGLRLVMEEIMGRRTQAPVDDEQRGAETHGD